MKLSDLAIRSLLDQLNAADGLSFRSYVWVRPDGSEAVLRRNPPGQDYEDWACAGCLEVIIRRGIEWEGEVPPPVPANRTDTTGSEIPRAGHRACKGCGFHFKEKYLKAGDGRFLGWCIDCDESKDPEIKAKLQTAAEE